MSTRSDIALETHGVESKADASLCTKSKSTKPLAIVISDAPPRPSSASRILRAAWIILPCDFPDPPLDPIYLTFREDRAVGFAFSFGCNSAEQRTSMAVTCLSTAQFAATCVHRPNLYHDFSWQEPSLKTGSKVNHVDLSSDACDMCNIERPWSKCVSYVRPINGS